MQENSESWQETADCRINVVKLQLEALAEESIKAIRPTGTKKVNKFSKLSGKEVIKSPKAKVPLAIPVAQLKKLGAEKILELFRSRYGLPLLKALKPKQVQLLGIYRKACK